MARLSFSTPPGEAGTRPVRPQKHRDPDFHEVRRAHRTFGTVAMLLSVGSFLLYVVLSSFAPELMGIQIAGQFTLGLICGLLEYIVMAATAGFYAVHMRRRVNPIVDRLRAEAQRSAALQQRAATPTAGDNRAW